MNESLDRRGTTCLRTSSEHGVLIHAKNGSFRLELSLSGLDDICPVSQLDLEFAVFEERTRLTPQTAVLSVGERRLLDSKGRTVTSVESRRF